MMKFYGKAEETGQMILRAFQSGSVPSALAPLFIQSSQERYCACWSWLNQLLVALHGYSDARTYKGWQDVQRQVRKGEKAFNIFEPVRVTVQDETTNEERVIVIGYKTGPRFGLEQTDGEPLPGTEQIQQFIDSLPLLAVAQAWGIRVSTYSGKEGKAHGYFRTRGNEAEAIALGVENLSTWAHELVHAADHRLGNLTEKGQHWRSETVAELGGCILLHMLGRPTEADSGGAWNYIQHYAQANDLDPLNACVEVLNRTCQAVSLIMQTDGETSGTVNETVSNLV
ncbi:MAG: hypothetical protein KF753_20295 [Caldilineaceae bacterium]|nr:hypothetical protein [Caldilineaceae bacterium]